MSLHPVGFPFPSFVTQTGALPAWIYPTEEEAGLVKTLLNFIQSHSRVVFLVDGGVLACIQQRFASIADFLKDQVVITPGSGESLKTKEVYWQVLEALETENFKREDALIVMGGGSLLDLGGFVASTYLRGVAYYSVPTTLLACVDAAIGGKTAINLGHSKNRVGTFYKPRALALYYPFLEGLSLRERASGFAEVIKYGLLGDPSFFSALEEKALLQAFQTQFLKKVIAHCIGMKLALVEQDDQDTRGRRWLLNLGHTFGHAIEGVSAYSRYTHGEAVAIGLMGAARFSASLGYINEETVKRIEQVLLNYALPTFLYEPLQVSALVEAMQKDKKAKPFSLRLVLLRSIGEAYIYELKDQDALRPIWLQLGALDGNG